MMRREKTLVLVRICIHLLVLVAFIACVVVLARAINSEIEECGGIFRCLGAAARDFDDARKGK